MKSPLSLLISISLMGCEPESPFRDRLPAVEAGEPLSLDNSRTQTDLLVQTTVPNVDILFVVDNSCSMGDDQQRLVDNFPTFMRWFLGSGLDYHIGVVSTDVYDSNQSGRLVKGFNKKWISPDDNNQVNMFNQMAVLGISGSGDERGTQAHFAAIEHEGDRYNEGFYRDEAAIHTIAVSDEPDYSDGNTGPSYPGFNEFVRWYDGLKRTADERTFSAIEDPNNTFGPHKYGDVTRPIGGVVYNIREANWAAALDALGLRATGMKTEYFLSQLPVDDTIAVEVQEPISKEGDFTALPIPRAWLDIEGNAVDDAGKPITDGSAHWYYTEGRNSITFLDYVPEETRTVQIVYTVRSSVTR